MIRNLKIYPPSINLPDLEEHIFISSRSCSPFILVQEISTPSAMHRTNLQEYAPQSTVGPWCGTVWSCNRIRNCLDEIEMERQDTCIYIYYRVCMYHVRLNTKETQFINWSTSSFGSLRRESRKRAWFNVPQISAALSAYRKLLWF